MMKLILLLILVLRITYVHTNVSNERTFPKYVNFGIATSAYQVEGAWNEGGRTPSIWDHAIHRNSNLIKDHSNADKAADTYHHTSSDVALLQELGVHFYRFSLSWSRILPTGFTNYVNSEGVAYYGHLINTLLANGILPYVTIYHWDLPQSLQDIGGWTNPLMADYFASYAKKCFELFGSRVTVWITINEPRQICEFGYSQGIFAPFLKYDGIGGYLCAKTVLLAHAKAYRIYQSHFRKKYGGKVGIAIESAWFESMLDSKHKSGERKLQFNFGAYAHPIFSKLGDWPSIMRQHIDRNSIKEGFQRSRLPTFTELEKNLIRGSSDFLGFNHYSSFLCWKPEPHETHHIPRPSFDADVNVFCAAVPDSQQTAAERFTVHPYGFRKILNWIKNEYNNPEIIIGENGFAGFPHDVPNDCRRISFLNNYLNAVLEAIRVDGVNVTAYTAWSFLDNFEWALGYTVKFGLYHVNFNDPNRERTAKMSAHVYRNIIKTKEIHRSYTPDGYEECDDYYFTIEALPHV